MHGIITANHMKTQASVIVPRNFPIVMTSGIKGIIGILKVL